MVVEGARAYLSFTLRNGELVAERTYTPPELRGRGIAAKLVQGMIEYAEEQGLKICPMCSYVVDYFSKRPELSQYLSERCER